MPQQQHGDYNLKLVGRNWQTFPCFPYTGIQPPITGVLGSRIRETKVNPLTGLDAGGLKKQWLRSNLPH